MSPGGRGLARPSRARDYPPLVAALLSLTLLLAMLPSALNLPQSNPAETLEYAPVPPEDENEVNPPAGNFSSLGLSGSQSISRGPAEEGLGAQETDFSFSPGGRALKAPSTKRCVGDPPRQTEDPLSPPCVGSYSGDNGGATYRGVTRDEIDVVLYVVGGGWRYDVGSRGVLIRPRGQYYDATEPRTDDDENYFVDAARTWQRYFNERYQTYGRFVHFHVYFSNGDSIESRRSDAAENFHRIKPFAVIVWDHPVGDTDPYIETMARYGVMNFGSINQRPAGLFSKFAPLVWGFEPSIEQGVHQFKTFVCNKVVPYPVQFGQSQDAGKPRKLGLILTEDPYFPNKTRFGELARDAIQECGGEFIAEARFPWTDSAGCCNTDEYAQIHMADFKSKGVTTIIWGQGYEYNYSRFAKALDYTPEWIIAGDGFNDDIASSKHQNQDVWSHAWIVSNVTLDGVRRQLPCYQAAREANPELAFQDSSITCQLYNHLRQLFTGIQVAGPRLSPATVDKGFHAIPDKPSTHPSQPSCFYEPNDYTCVKDAIPMWWDPSAESPYSSTTGCWRVPEGGKRYLARDWPQEPVSARRSPNDPCNGYSTGRVFDPAPGPESPPPQ